MVHLAPLIPVMQVRLTKDAAKIIKAAIKKTLRSASLETSYAVINGSAKKKK